LDDLNYSNLFLFFLAVLLSKLDSWLCYFLLQTVVYSGWGLVGSDPTSSKNRWAKWGYELQYFL